MNTNDIKKHEIKILKSTLNKIAKDTKRTELQRLAAQTLLYTHKNGKINELQSINRLAFIVGTTVYRVAKTHIKVINDALAIDAARHK